MTSLTNNTENFKAAVEALNENQVKFQRGEVKSVQHAQARDELLQAAVYALGQQNGITLQTPMRIDARGEMSLVVMPKSGGDPKVNGCGQYGEAFAQILNNYDTRTGTQPGRRMMPENGWCHINHFDAEKMVKTQYDQQLRIEQAQKAMDAVSPDALASKRSGPK